jgi:hypothetical protein
VRRRSFLAGLIATGLAATLDPEKVLWEPGRKLISIPTPQSAAYWLQVGDVLHLPPVRRVDPQTGIIIRSEGRAVVTRIRKDGFVGVYPMLPCGPILPAKIAIEAHHKAEAWLDSMRNKYGAARINAMLLDAAGA